MKTQALGTRKQGDTIDADVAHDPRASYGRSVTPAAKKNVERLGLWFGWSEYETSIIDTDEVLGDGRCVSTVRFTRTR